LVSFFLLAIPICLIILSIGRVQRFFKDNPRTIEIFIQICFSSISQKVVYIYNISLIENFLVTED